MKIEDKIQILAEALDETLIVIDRHHKRGGKRRYAFTKRTIWAKVW